MTWIRKRKKYTKPRKLYDKSRIGEENVLIKKYGLKNKKEIWKTESAVKKIRDRGKRLITASEEEKQKLFEKLGKIGLKIKTIADILALNKENILKRRLQTIITGKGMAKTPKHARQLIVHKHIAINDKVINIPSYLVSVDEEDKIKITKELKVKPEKKEAEKSIVEQKIEEAQNIKS